METNELYVTIETGGSIGEIYNHGRYRVSSDVFKDKQECIAYTRRMSKNWGGGYYGYKYSTKTLAWAIKNCEKLDIVKLINNYKED